MSSGGYAPVKNKCTWWRETLNVDDAHNLSVKRLDKRVNCTCSVEGQQWTYVQSEVPVDCPESRRCRYYIKNC
jgi:hypothetical protein